MTRPHSLRTSETIIGIVVSVGIIGTITLSILTLYSRYCHAQH